MRKIVVRREAARHSTPFCPNLLLVHFNEKDITQRPKVDKLGNPFFRVLAGVALVVAREVGGSEGARMKRRRAILNTFGAKPSSIRCPQPL